MQIYIYLTNGVPTPVFNNDERPLIETVTHIEGKVFKLLTFLHCTLPHFVVFLRYHCVSHTNTQALASIYEFGFLCM